MAADIERERRRRESRDAASRRPPPPPADSLAAAIYVASAIYAADIENRVREREEEEREEILPPSAPPPQPSCRRRRPAAADSRKIQDIVMYVNSPGGSVTAGMAIFDMMRHIRPDVSTVCVGLAASMGAFLLSSGTKGKRYGLPNSRIMIHQPLGGAQGGQTDIDIQPNEMLHHKANLNRYLAYHTGQSLEKINQDTDRDFFMSAKEAEEYGFIDGVIMNPLRAFQPLAA